LIQHLASNQIMTVMCSQADCTGWVTHSLPNKNSWFNFSPKAAWKRFSWEKYLALLYLYDQEFFNQSSCCCRNFYIIYAVN